MSTVTGRLPADWPLWSGLLTVQAIALGIYGLTAGGIDAPRYVIYPFVWINAGLFAVSRIERPSSSPERRRLAAGVAVTYGLLLAIITGLVGLPLIEHAHTHPIGLSVSLSVPGWGPRIAYVLGDAHIYFVPYRVVGYVALSYLLYVRLAALSPAAGAGVIGLVACVGCALPLVAGALWGAGAAALTAVGGYSLDLSTLAFLTALIGLWQPWQGG